MTIEIGNLLKVPRGTPNLEPLEFELSDIIRAEQRKAEIAYVNKETGPELLMIFNEAYCSVKRMMNQINVEFLQARKHADQRRAIVILDVVPEVLKAKGLATSRSPGGSEDLRKAILDLDVEHTLLTDKVQALEAGYEFLSIKAKGFEMAYQAVKKTFDPFYGGLGTNNQTLRTTMVSSEIYPEWK